MAKQAESKVQPNDRQRHRFRPKAMAQSPGAIEISGPPPPGKNLKPISEQVVVVFGASSGIGRETALEFARQGAKVVAVGAKPERVWIRLQEDFGHRQSRFAITVCVADATDFEQVKSAVARTSGRKNSDAWIRGFTARAFRLYATFENTTPEEFKQVIEVNLLGAVQWRARRFAAFATRKARRFDRDFFGRRQARSALPKRVFVVEARDYRFSWMRCAWNCSTKACRFRSRT